MSESMPEQDVFEVDLYEYVQVLYKRKATILVIFLAATLMSAILSWFILPPSYEARTSLMVDTQSFAGLPVWAIDTYINIAKGAKELSPSGRSGLRGPRRSIRRTTA
ncbi:MAG: hypothetical protein HPY71_01135 [Firmicutes bacterium]|nr:hypothetical protein [Bacillota bacterium]